MMCPGFRVAIHLLGLLWNDVLELEGHCDVIITRKQRIMNGCRISQFYHEEWIDCFLFFFLIF